MEEKIYGKNIKTHYVCDALYTVQDVPYMIQEHREDFNYDDGIWIHKEDSNKWCTNTHCSESLVRWLEEIGVFPPVKKLSARYGDTSSINPFPPVKFSTKKKDVPYDPYMISMLNDNAIRKGRKISGRYGNKDVISSIDHPYSVVEKYWEDIPMSGPDILPMSDYIFANRLSFSTPMEFRTRPKANISFYEVWDELSEEDKKLKNIPVNIQLSISDDMIYISKELADAYKSCYRYISNIFNNRKDVSIAKDRLQKMLDEKSIVLQLVSEDYIKFVINFKPMD